jgi:hypothetical protein
MISSTRPLLAMVGTAMRACQRLSCQVDTPTTATSTASIPRPIKIFTLNSRHLHIRFTATSGGVRTGKVVTAAALLKINIRAPLENSPGRQTSHVTAPAIIRGRISLQPMATSCSGRIPKCHNKQRAHARKHRNRLPLAQTIPITYSSMLSLHDSLGGRPAVEDDNGDARVRREEMGMRAMR